MIEFWNSSSHRIIELTLQHIQLVGISIMIAFLLSSSIVFLLLYNKKILESTVYMFSLMYAIPSLALFALLIPITGLGQTTAIVVLVIYSQYILLRNFVTGLQEVDSVMVEAAFALGMTKKQVFFKVQLPLAVKSVFASIRITATSTIGIASIAATINAGGLGVLLFEGLRTLNLIKLTWGTLLIVGLCLLVNLVIIVAEQLVVRRID